QISNILLPFESILQSDISTEDTLSYSNTETQNQRLGVWLYQQGFDINPQVLDILQNILDYTQAHQIEHSGILTLIDYSIPANQKRLWVLDLDKQKVLFHTYVSHGLKTGTLQSHFFSNRFDSKASSIGVYLTDKPYYGRHGLSLKLNGLEYGFNDNAESRAIVMHGGWYVEENFIQKYGRAGRSWGCPAVPDQEIAPIINTIKDKGLLVVYYPSAEWFKKSRFLRHDAELLIQSDNHQADASLQESEETEDILLAQLQKKNKYHESEAILVMPVERYSSLFQNHIPLKRMLRRQIDDQEYIALSNVEFNQLLDKNMQQPNSLQDIYFVVPSIKMVRGYYATEMNKINLGKILVVQHHTALTDTYTVNFDNQSSVYIKTSHRFIRWLGL
ncbi:MAG TPA: murein L,D-transpeptidase catalytic domain family protein, partial [Legionellaceae bacterium]|nr:murein L,D-transpeptidase catalytic domain family protein [Legionellaceae bacterium]